MSRRRKYVLDKYKDVSIYSGINQNYAWGQDSWRDFRLAMKDLDPKATVDKELFPKLFAGEYGAEISTLLTSNAQFIHSSFYDGDLEAFMYQAAARGLPQRIPFVLTAGETSLYRLGPKLPDGTIIGARGPHSFFAHDSALNTWFQKIYVDRFHEQPVYPSYDFAQSLFGLKAAWEKAQAKKGGSRPTTEEVIAAFEGISFPTPSTTVQMTLGNGHQGITDIAYGTYKFDKAARQADGSRHRSLPRRVCQSAGERRFNRLARRRHERRQVQLRIHLLRQGGGRRGQRAGWGSWSC